MTNVYWEDHTQNALSSSRTTAPGLSKFTVLLKNMSGLRSENLYELATAYEVDLHGSKDGSSCDVSKCCGRDISSGRALGRHRCAHRSLLCLSNISASLPAGWNANHHNQANVGEKLEYSNSPDYELDDAQPSFQEDDGPDVDGDRAVSDSKHPSLSCRSELDVFRATAGESNKASTTDCAGVAVRANDEPLLYAIRGQVDADDEEEDRSFNVSASSAIYSNGDGAIARGEGIYDAKKLLYTLRRNPKPSKRLVDQEFAAMAALQQQQGRRGAGAEAPWRKSSTCFKNVRVEKNLHACTECGKAFFSSKALFGHMRLHPEREWRGIQRPRNQLDQEKPAPASEHTSTPSTACGENFRSMPVLVDQCNEESTEAVYVNKGGGRGMVGLQSWMTRKRSKRSRQLIRSLRAMTERASAESFSFSVCGEITEDADMANCLVMLARANGNQKELPQIKKLRSTMSLHSNDIRHETRCDKGQHRRGSKDPPFRVKPVKVYADDNRFCEGMQEETAMDHVYEGKPKYECCKCKRIFKSHQALGGHRATHKKVKGCFATSTHEASDGKMLDLPLSPEEDITDDEEERLLLTIGGSKLRAKLFYGDEEKEESSDEYCWKTSWGEKHMLSESNSRRIRGHECSICHRVFPSGQALGGHKRCHWGGAASDTSASTIVPGIRISQKQQNDPAEAEYKLLQRTGREELLDLNLPAPEEIEDDDL